MGLKEGRKLAKQTPVTFGFCSTCVVGFINAGIAESLGLSPQMFFLFEFRRYFIFEYFVSSYSVRHELYELTVLMVKGFKEFMKICL